MSDHTVTDGMAAHELIQKSLHAIRHRLSDLTRQHGLPREPTLIAVSKLKPVSMIQYAYKCGQRDFGENYVQELISKFNDPSLSDSSHADLRWHYIGHLQSNKCNQLIKQCGEQRLYCVHSCDSVKILNALNKACVNAGWSQRLRVLIQVNTSNESSKSGCDPSEVIDLYRHCIDHCAALQPSGLMTIGSVNDTDGSTCFDLLSRCKSDVMSALSEKLSVDDFELSMGMSGDYETAVQYGATMVRIGSTIFGQRDYGESKPHADDSETQR